LTGKYNFAYLGWMPLPQHEATLPQILSQAGYLTGAVVDTPFYVRNGYGYDRGFDNFIWNRGQGLLHERVYQEAVGNRRYEEDYFAPATMATAEEWLEAHRTEKFFLLVDTWDPHEPWDPPPYYVELYERNGLERPAVTPPYWYWEEAGLTKAQLSSAHAHYCGEITMVDRAIGRLLERVESLGIMDDTAIIFTSDHGFYFGEHGILGKGLFSKGEEDVEWHRCPLFDEICRVPLIIRVPGGNAARVSSMITSPDLMPTILDLAEVPVPASVQSASLLPMLGGQDRAVHDFLVTSWPFHDLHFKLKVVDDVARTTTEILPTTTTAGEWTLISSVEGAPVELYNTQVDPQQETNVFEANKAVARGLHTQLVQFLEELGTDERFLSPRRYLL
jgi:arylsulfatase A-like enzyme